MNEPPVQPETPTWLYWVGVVGGVITSPLNLANVVANIRRDPIVWVSLAYRSFVLVVVVVIAARSAIALYKRSKLQEPS